MLIEPGVADFQQRQIDLGRLIADQHHPGGELAPVDGAHQQLLVIAEVLPVIDVVRGGQHQPTADQIPRPAGPPIHTHLAGPRSWSTSTARPGPIVSAVTLGACAGQGFWAEPR